MQPNQELFGKNDSYLIEGPLGEGGFGLTYRARRKSDGQAVVVKLLKLERAGDWKAVELFEREAKVLESLSHPRIPQYIDSFSLGDPSAPQGFGLVQSLIEGRTLKEVMRAKEHLPQEQMHRWLWQMLEVCHYLHTLSPPVIHRDINPKNIILTPSHDAVLIDFGTVQAKAGSQHSVSSTSAGTFGYAPMEQFVGRATPSSDLYGLAMTFLAVSTGKEPEQLPFDGNRINVRQALSGVNVDARILLMLDRMTDPDSTRRVNNAQEVMERLRGIYQPPAPRKERAASKTIVGRICFRCEGQVGFDDKFCDHCGSDLNPANWHELLPDESASKAPAAPSVMQATTLTAPPPPKDVSSWGQAHKKASHWRDVATRLSQISQEQILAARPGIPLGDFDFVAINDAATQALLVSYEGFYLLTLPEMKVQRLFTDEHIAGRRGAFSADGKKLLVADCYGPVLYFIDLSGEGEPQIRAVGQPEIREFSGDCSIAVSPDHQLAAIMGEDKQEILLLDWASGGIVDRIKFEIDDFDDPLLSFSPDGSLLLCSTEKKTLLFDTEGNRQELPASRIAISPDGRQMAAVLYKKTEDDDYEEIGLHLGKITRLSPFAWEPKPLKHRKKDDHYLKGIRFSADSTRLLLHVSLRDKDGDDEALDIVTTGQPNQTIYEPLYPGRCFSSIKAFAMSASGHLSLFADSRPSYYSNDTTDSLLFFDAALTPRYLGAVQFVKRTEQVGSNVFIGGKMASAGALGPNVIINQAPQPAEVKNALAMFAAPPGDPDLSLPFGQTVTGYFGRLDLPNPIGAAEWSCPLEHPELTQRVLTGENEGELLSGVELLCRDDLEERLRFWHSMRAEKFDLRALVNASIGLTHLLPAIVTRAAESAKGKARFGRGENATPSEASLLATCKEVAGLSEAERGVLFEEMCARLDAEEKQREAAQAPKAPKAPEKKPEAAAPVAVAAPQAPPTAPPSAPAAAVAPRHDYINALEELGLFSSSYIALLALPLCEVLWADGTPQKEEVALVQGYIKRLIEVNDGAFPAMEWLQKKPSPELFEKGRALLRALILGGYYPDLTKERAKEALALCQQIASASGGFLGLGKVSKEEKGALAKIEAALSF